MTHSHSMAAGGTDADAAGGHIEDVSMERIQLPAGVPVQGRAFFTEAI